MSTAGHSDLTACLLGFVWHKCERETLIEATRAILDRLEGAPDGLVQYELIEAAESLGVVPLLPLEHAYRCLDVLERLGAMLPRATIAAVKVEERIRLEQG